MRTAAVALCFLLSWGAQDLRAVKDKKGKVQEAVTPFQVYYEFDGKSDSFARFFWTTSEVIPKEEQYNFDLRLDKYYPSPIKDSLVEYNQIQIEVASSKDWQKVCSLLKPILKEFLKLHGPVYMTHTTTHASAKAKRNMNTCGGP